MLELLKKNSASVGKAEWQELLIFTAELHERALHAPFFKLPFLWEELAPEEDDYILFGHWDSVHIAYDCLEFEPEHARNQLLNILALQGDCGFIPGHVYIYDRDIHWRQKLTSPPIWAYVMQIFLEKNQEDKIKERAYEALCKQLIWFEKERSIQEAGFYYLDILDNFCESGTEGSVRFNPIEGLARDFSCVDASSHLFLLYNMAANWGCNKLWAGKRDQLRTYIQTKLFNNDGKFFIDAWQKKVVLCFDGFWPLIVGAATHSQAQAVIENYLIKEDHFFTPHPLPSLSLSEEEYDSLTWRGPVRNSMTFWVAKACVRYGYPSVGKKLLERALDQTAKHFRSEGVIWECYDPMGFSASTLKTYWMGELCSPRKNYLGHNPLIAMAILWEKLNAS